MDPLARRFSFLLEGEPDGAAEAALADPSPPATDPLPPPEGGGEPGAGVEDGGSGGDEADDGELEEQDGEEPIDLDPETARAYFRVYGEHFKQTPEYQEELRAVRNAARDEALAEAQADPQQDKAYVASVTLANRAYETLGSLRDKLKAGEEVDPETIVNTALTLAAGSRASAVREQYHGLDGAIQRTLAQLRVALPETHPLHAAYDEAQETFERNQNDRDPKTRQQAFTMFARQAIGAFAGALVEHGRAIERSNKTQRAADLERVKGANLVTEAAAKAARRTPPPPSGRPKAQPVLTTEALMAGDWRQTQKLMEAAGHRI